MKLGTALKADAVVIGVVKEYGEVRSGSATGNVVSLSVQLLETKTGRVVWAGASTKGGVTMGDRLLGGGGVPLNYATEAPSMTSSTRCSGNRRASALVAALVLASAAGCGHRAAAPVRRLGPAEPGSRPRIAVLPIDNLSGRRAGEGDGRRARARARGARRGRRRGRPRGLPLPAPAASHGGIDGASARAAREELGAHAVLVTSLTVYHAASPPALGLTARLVSTGGEPEISGWTAFAWAGDQAPGLLGLGRMERMAQVQEHVLGQLASSLDAFLAGEAGDVACGGSRYRPKVRFRSAELDSGEHHTVAVVPFLDHSKRRGAGEAVALEFVRQLVANGRYRVLEPGVVRDYLLRARVLLPAASPSRPPGSSSAASGRTW